MHEEQWCQHGDGKANDGSEKERPEPRYGLPASHTIAWLGSGCAGAAAAKARLTSIKVKACQPDLLLQIVAAARKLDCIDEVRSCDSNRRIVTPS
jgi:hypothetical protein